MNVRFISFVDTAHDSESGYDSSSTEFLSQRNTSSTWHHIRYHRWHRDVLLISTAATVISQPNTQKSNLNWKDRQSCFNSMCVICTGELVYLSTSVCMCAFLCLLYICVCFTEGCLTPNRCHYFPLASSHLSMSAEVFLLFCLCYFVCECMHTLMRVWYGETWRHACVCVWVCASQNFCLLKSSSAFWLAEEYVKSHFLLKFLQQSHCGTSSLTASRESVQVTGTNAIFHLFQEQAFELTAYVAWLSVRLAVAGLMCWRVGWDSPWEERDDTINYISKKLAEGVKMCLCECCTWLKAAERRCA